jgi:hypothetical protein
MFFGGLYISFYSRKLVDKYNEEHRAPVVAQKVPVKANGKSQKRAL